MGQGSRAPIGSFTMTFLCKRRAELNSLMECKRCSAHVLTEQAGDTMREGGRKHRAVLALGLPPACCCDIQLGGMAAQCNLLVQAKGHNNNNNDNDRNNNKNNSNSSSSSNNNNRNHVAQVKG
eukprot:1158747-Pelagomonas_calceolata.AAC.21